MVSPKNYSSAPNINLGERVGYIKKRYMFNKTINKVSQRTFFSHLSITNYTLSSYNKV